MERKETGMKLIETLMKKKADLQIAPLIDIVFLLLIYFMVTSSLIKKEADLSFALPYIPVKPLPEHPIEVLIEVSELGDILVEGMIFKKDEQHLPRLTSLLASLNAAAHSSGSELIVSILPDDKALHGRIISVMDACSAARVQNMSFSMAL
jgi:biopolymer transport protein ExbD